MPPRGWRKGKPPEKVPDSEPARGPVPEVEVFTEDQVKALEKDAPPGIDAGPAAEPKESEPGPRGGGPASGVSRGSGPATSPDTKQPEPTFDEEAAFIRPEDVAKEEAKSGPAHEPGDSGWVADMVAAAGEKLHETEYAVTGDRVFLHTPADERIWRGLGKYVEKYLDPAKYGLVVLVIVLLGAESMKVAIYAKHRADAKPKETPK